MTNPTTAWTLQLQSRHSKFSEFFVYALAENTAAEAAEVEAMMAAALPGEFVCVPIRFVNLPDPTKVYIQPHHWGLWTITQRHFTPDQLLGGS